MEEREVLRFRLDRMEFLRVAVYESKREKEFHRGTFLLFLLGLLCVAAQAADPEAGGGWMFLCPVVMVCIYWVSMVWITCQKKGGFSSLNDLEIGLDGDWFMISGAACYRVCVSRLGGVRRVGKLYLIDFQWVWEGEYLQVVLPVRAFASEEEGESFIHKLQERAKAAVKEEYMAAQRCEDGCGEEKEAQEPGSDRSFWYYMEETGLAHMFAVWYTAEYRVRKKRIDIGIFLGSLTAIALVLSWSLLRWIGVCAIFVIWIYILYCQKASTTESACRNMVSVSRHFEPMLGEWRVDFAQDWIRCRFGSREYFFGWKGLEKVIQVEDVYILCYEKAGSYISIPVNLFQTEEEEQDFLEYCRSRDLKPPMQTVMVRKGKEKDVPWVRWYQRTEVAVLALLLGILGLWLVRETGDLKYDSARGGGGMNIWHGKIHIIICPWISRERSWRSWDFKCRMMWWRG